MLASGATARQQELYADAMRQTLQSLNTVDDATLVGLTRMGIREVQELKQEVAEILPAGNLPAFLLQGLVQLKARALKPERVAADLRLIFQATKQVGLFGTFLVPPALVLHGYQKLLLLAGKDVESAFPDGTWQFYTEFGLREDAARHCAETVGFQQAAPHMSELDGATCWVYVALRTIFSYDELLANEWDERMLFRTLDILIEEQASAQFSPTAAPGTQEHAQQLADTIARLRTTYGVDRLAAGWAAIRPYRLPADTPRGDYAAFRRAQFGAYLNQALRQLPPEVRADLDARFAARRAAELPAYQRQMTLLMTLDAENYQDRRIPLPLHQTRVALVMCGRYSLIEVCARDSNGRLLVYPLDGGATSSGMALPLHDTSDGTLRDSHDRPVTIDRRGRVKIGNMAVGMLRPPSLESVKQQVAAILQHAGGEQTSATGDSRATDLLLAQAPRERQRALRALLTPETHAELQALRAAPIIINWDAHDGGQPLTAIRQTHRGIGDHALTVIRTDRSMVFDLSHIFFDGGLGMALAEIMTNMAAGFVTPAIEVGASADLYNFGATLQALKQVTMRGEGFSTAALRLLGHLPQTMQHLLDLIPQKIGVLNEILKGREGFSNVGQVVATSTLTRFVSARDDGETKLLIWGVMSDANGRLVVTLRDLRPHVAPLKERGRADLAEALAQDYLDDYAAGVNALVRRVQRVLAYA